MEKAMIDFTKYLKVIVVAASLTGFVGCSDFLNQSKNSVSGARPAERQGPKRPDVNPLPAGYEDPNVGQFSEGKMLVNIGLNVIARSAADFSLESSVLERRLGEACGQASVAVDLNRPTWDEARVQWKRAMMAFHRVDSFPVGPLSADGRRLASQLYAWPLFNSCGIDLETIKHKEGIGTAASDLPAPVRGLGALEYLLFEESMTTRCNARAYPQVVSWTGLSAEEKRLDRCRLALKIASNVREGANILADEWSPAGRNFTRKFIDKSDPAMPNVLSATNALTDSLFQIEALKDQRLARPLGRTKDCASESGICPEDVEHPFAGLALEAVTVRLTAFQDAFQGRFTTDSDRKVVNGFGFDDFLVARGHSDVAVRFDESIEAARRGFASVRTNNLADLIQRMSIEECQATTSTQRKVEICALWQDVRTVSIKLKTDLLTVLALRAPPTYQGDND
jgi:predicted lipoprotein